MGCAEVKDPTQNLPTIVCTIENGNDNQKQYCINLRDNFNYPKSVKYEIKANATSTFIIMLNYNGQNHIIQDRYDENELQSSLQKIYDLLDGTGNNNNQNMNPNENPNANLNPNPNTYPNENPNMNPIENQNMNPNENPNMNQNNI